MGNFCKSIEKEVNSETKNPFIERQRIEELRRATQKFWETRNIIVDITNCFNKAALTSSPRSVRVENGNISP